MRFGQQIQYSTRHTRDARDKGNLFDTTLAVARACEEAGFDSVWYSDHFMFGDPEDRDTEVEILECFTTLAALAATTQRVMLGEYVAGAPYRNPALTAKMCATLDVISHGRSIVGLGSAWHRPEFEAYGWPFPGARERSEALQDTIEIVLRMLTDSPATYEGLHLSIHNALSYPRPVQRPRPPLMIGGGGEKYTLPLVARYADMYNIWGGTPEYVAQKFGALRRRCEEIGRHYDEIVRTNHVSILIARNETDLARKRERFTDPPSQPPLIGTPETIIAGLRRYAASGSQYAIIDLLDWQNVESTYLFGETVIPALRDL